MRKKSSKLQDFQSPDENKVGGRKSSKKDVSASMFDDPADEEVRFKYNRYVEGAGGLSNVLKPYTSKNAFLYVIFDKWMHVIPQNNEF